jgi:hypothetical protein
VLQVQQSTVDVATETEWAKFLRQKVMLPRLLDQELAGSAVEVAAAVKCGAIDWPSFTREARSWVPYIL